MAKALNYILTPVSLIDRNLGNVLRTAALTAAGTAIGGPIGGAIGGAIGSGLAATIGRNFTPAQKSETSETAIKTERPVRIRAYGVSRLQARAQFLM
jgi:hypothetical protein